MSLGLLPCDWVLLGFALLCLFFFLRLAPRDTRCHSLSSVVGVALRAAVEAAVEAAAVVTVSVVVDAAIVMLLLLPLSSRVLDARGDTGVISTTIKTRVAFALRVNERRNVFVDRECVSKETSFGQ